MSADAKVPAAKTVEELAASLGPLMPSTRVLPRSVNVSTGIGAASGDLSLAVSGPVDLALVQKLVEDRHRLSQSTPTRSRDSINISTGAGAASGDFAISVNSATIAAIPSKNESAVFTDKTRCGAAVKALTLKFALSQVKADELKQYEELQSNGFNIKDGKVSFWKCPEFTKEMTAVLEHKYDKCGGKTALEVLQIIQAGADSKRNFVFVNGGAVRDVLVGLKPKDVDVVIQCTLGAAQSAVKIIPNLTWTTPTTSLTRIGEAPHCIELVPMNLTYLKGSDYSDFPLNTLAYDIKSNILIVQDATALDDIRNGWISLPSVPRAEYITQWARSLRFWKLRAKGWLPTHGDECALLRAMNDQTSLKSGSKDFEEFKKRLYEAVSPETYGAIKQVLVQVQMRIDSSSEVMASDYVKQMWETTFQIHLPRKGHKTAGQ